MKNNKQFKKHGITAGCVCHPPNLNWEKGKEKMTTRALNVVALLYYIIVVI
jgi:hypothetical protein